jgi:hypothetical protein
MSPVDSLAPKASAIRVTIIMAIPLSPALEIPRITEAENANIQDVVEISKIG